MKAALAGLTLALSAGASAHALTLPMACDQWRGLNRVLVEVQTVRFHPYVLDANPNNRTMSCRSADVTGRVVGGLSKGARTSGKIRFSALESACAGADDRPDDAMPKRGDQVVLAWTDPGPDAGDYWVSEYRAYLADQKECALGRGR